MTGGHAVWVVVSLLTAGMQVALGTGGVFVTLSLLIFLLLPFAYGPMKAADSLGAVLTLATFSKLFVLSQWFKILYLQAADTHLDEPETTALVILAGLFATIAAALVLRALLPALRWRLLPVSTDPDFLRALGVGTFVLVALAMVMRHRIGLDRLGLDDPGAVVRGEGLVLWNHLAALLPLSSALFTARRMILSGGQRVLDGWVVASIGVCGVAGLWENSRTVMFNGFVTFYLTYLFYGGRIRTLHVLGVLVAALLMHTVVFPLIDIQRSLPPGLSPSEYINETAELAIEVLGSEQYYLYTGTALVDAYDSIVTRLYYGEPTGFLDRLAPSQVDEVVEYVLRKGTFGWEYAFYPLTRLIPYMVLTQFGLDHPVMGGTLIEGSIWNFSNHTYMNYGIIAEMYSYLGLATFPFAYVFYMIFFMVFMHVVYGGMKNNYFGAFCAATYLLVIADGDAPDFTGKLLEQGVVYVTLYAVARAAWFWWRGAVVGGLATMGRWER